MQRRDGEYRVSRTATILIVDDQEANRRLLEVLLKPEGYLTITASDGHEALAAVADNSIDLILLDVMMPKMDGYELATHLEGRPQHEVDSDHHGDRAG